MPNSLYLTRDLHLYLLVDLTLTFQISEYVSIFYTSQFLKSYEDQQQTNSSIKLTMALLKAHGILGREDQVQVTLGFQKTHSCTKDCYINNTYNEASAQFIMVS